MPGFQEYIHAGAAPSRAAAALSPSSIPADERILGCTFIHGGLIPLGLSHFLKGALTVFCSYAIVLQAMPVYVYYKK